MGYYMNAKLLKNNAVRTVMQGICMLVIFCCFGCLYLNPANEFQNAPINYTENARKLLKVVFIAIHKYRCNANMFPDENNLLMNLLMDSGVEGWSGPYITEFLDEIDEILSEGCIIERPDENTYMITLEGKDGILGTEDDIIGKYQLTTGKGYANVSLRITGDGYLGGVSIDFD